MVLLPSPTSINVSSETVEKKMGLPKPSTPSTIAIGKSTMLPNLLFFNDSKTHKIYILSKILSSLAIDFC